MDRKYLLKLLTAVIVLMTALLVYLFGRPIVAYWGKPLSTVTFSTLTQRDQAPVLQWFRLNTKLSEPAPDERPDLLWLSDATTLSLELTALINQNVVVGEGLTLDQILTPNTLERIERTFHIKPTGYTGKYFTELGDPREVPRDVRDQYEAQSHKPWAFRGRGILLMSPSKIVVLREGIDFNGPLQVHDKTVSEAYHGYFEWILTDEPVEATLSIATTPAGDKLLKANDLPKDFPLVTRFTNDLYTGYYVAGQVTKENIQMPFFLNNAKDYMRDKWLYERDSNERLLWKWFMPLLNTLVDQGKAHQEAYKKNLQAQGQESGPLKPSDLALPTFRTFDKRFEIRGSDGKWRPFYMQGVNLGPALPGKAFTEFPQSQGIYRRWLEKMKTLNINTLRVYTLLPPSFYKALYDFNQAQEDPIYLLQEIWPEEKPPGDNYLNAAYNAAYQEEMTYVIGALHGDITIPKRSFRSYGVYGYDVSKYLLGYLVGRELEPDEVLATNAQNKGYFYYGDYFYSQKGASPTEAWLTASCDYVRRYEAHKYKKLSLIGIVSWPTLDPLRHPTEYAKDPQPTAPFNDKAVVDINHIGINPNATYKGFFGAYHIYPNYPDFIVNAPEYALYKDDQGQLRYGGYLKAFMKTQVTYPALVAEYGISTSSTTAHFSSDGLNHGGIPENQQAGMIQRLAKVIQREAYAGAILFEWMDEWTKRTWTTEPLMIPFNRHMLWHNLLDPEQNYGILGSYAAFPKLTPLQSTDLTSVKGLAPSPQPQILAGQNNAWYELTFQFKSEADRQHPFTLWIDTVPSKTPIPEFKLQWDGKNASLFANTGYNWTRGKFAAVSTGTYDPMSQLVNKAFVTADGLAIPEKRQDLTALKMGTYDDYHAQVIPQGTSLTLRLPYMLIGFSDPSGRRVLYDENPPIAIGQDLIGTLTIEALHLSLNRDGHTLQFQAPLKSWDEPDYYQMPKQGFDQLKREK